MPWPLNVRDHRSFLLSALSMLPAQSFSHVCLFATPWAVVHQASSVGIIFIERKGEKEILGEKFRNSMPEISIQLCVCFQECEAFSKDSSKVEKPRKECTWNGKLNLEVQERKQRPQEWGCGWRYPRIFMAGEDHQSSVNWIKMLPHGFLYVDCWGKN